MFWETEPEGIGKLLKIWDFQLESAHSPLVGGPVRCPGVKTDAALLLWLVNADGSESSASQLRFVTTFQVKRITKTGNVANVSKLGSLQPVYHAGDFLVFFVPWKNGLVSVAHREVLAA